MQVLFDSMRFPPGVDEKRAIFGYMTALNGFTIEAIEHGIRKFLRGECEGVNPKYRRDCGCRKPKPGMLLQAARDLDIDLSASYMVGDGITDIQAGCSAGCKTIMIGRLKCDLCRVMDDMKVSPGLVVPNLLEAARTIQAGGF